MYRRAGWLLIMPAILFAIITYLVPIGMATRLSLYKTDYVTEIYVGIENYADAVRDESFLQSFKNALFYAAILLPANTILAYFLASVMNEMREKVRGAVMFAIYAPYLASGAIVAGIWKWIFSRQGVVNWILGWVGIPAVAWFSDPLTAKIAICVIILAGAGGSTLVFVAQMASIPKELFEQAIIDGASRRQVRRRIILPQMLPTIALVSFLNMIGIFQIWETIMVITNGGPGGGTASPVFDAYLTSFVYSKYGLGMAKNLIFMVFIAVLSIVKRQIEKRWVVGD